jgi:hypothetical protein
VQGGERYFASGHGPEVVEGRGVCVVGELREMTGAHHDWPADQVRDDQLLLSGPVQVQAE